MNIGDKVAKRITEASGSTAAALGSVILIVAWSIGGFFVGFGDTYQLLINTITTVATFCVVFFIQNSQNRDTIAIQAKLDEIIAATSGARNDMVAIEKDSSQKEIENRRKSKDDC